MDHAELPRRSRGNMGGAARVLALGLAMGSWPLHTNGVMAASDLPKAAAAAATPQGIEECGLRITLWGETAACGGLRGPARCDEPSLAGRPERVQAMVGDVPREAGIIHGTEASSEAWREVLHFGCVEGRDILSVTLFDKSLRPLAICEVGEIASIESGEALVCDGAHGVQFDFAVEHANLAPSLVQPQRVLQADTPTPSPEAEAEASEAPDTPSPVEAAEDPTEVPTAAETPGPTPEPEPETDAPVTPATTIPVDAVTPAPVTPATTPPVTPRTPAPVTPDTPAPVTPATDPPVTLTPAPVTPEATAEPTARPVAVTPQPTPRATTEPPVPATTPAPVTPLVAATPEPTVGTPPATDAPVSTQPPPTLEPTVVPVTPAPSEIGTDAPVAAPVAAPIASPTQTPASATATPVASPPITVTSSPSAAESPTSAPGTSTPSAEDDDSDASTTNPVAAPPPTASPSTAQPVTLSPVGSSPRDVTSSPSTIPPTATAPVLPPTTEMPTSPTGTSTPAADDDADADDDDDDSPPRNQPVATPTPTPPTPTNQPVAPPTAGPPANEPGSPPVAEPLTPTNQPVVSPVAASPTDRPVAPPVAGPPPPTNQPVSPPVAAPLTNQPVTPPVAAPPTPTNQPVTPPVANPPTGQPVSAPVAGLTIPPVAFQFTAAPVESPPPVTPLPVLQPTSSTTASPLRAAPAPSASSSSSTAPATPPPPTPSPPSASPASPPSSNPSADLATPGPTPAVPTLPPSRVTAAPATTAPQAATISPADSATPAPTSSLGATLSPNTAEICTDACINENETSSDWTHTYYDARCEGLSTSELAGCNVFTAADARLVNCRTCILNVEEWEVESPANTADYPLCPCCVASSLSMDPQTEECEEEVAVAPTPSPTVAGEVSIDLRTSANDPDLMMIQFNSDDCSASGIAIISTTTVLQVTRYSGEDGTCGNSFDLLYGTECVSDETEYDWDYTTSNFQYNYVCTEEVTRLRRSLAEGTKTFSFQAEGSDTVLCNDGLTFITLSNLEGEDEGLVYAKPTAVDFDTISEKQTSKTDTTYCGTSMDLNTVTTSVLETGVSNVLDEPDDSSSSEDGIALEYVIPAVCVLVLLMGCGCFCCYRHRKGKEGRADQMRRNLGYTPDMEAKGEGNFGPTNKHVAITRGGGAQVTPEMLATKTYTQPTYPATHHRAPSEAPSSVIEDNIANNYRPKTAAKSWRKRKEHKELTKPASQQHVVGAAPTSEDPTPENTRSHSASARSEQLSERSLTQLELANQTQAAQPNYGYTFEEVEEDDEDDDARSAATGMSGPSKYAPSGYAPSSHHGGVTHDLMSQYEPSVYEADSQYDPSLYGRESEYGDESSSYSYNDGGASSRRGGYGAGGGGRGGRGHISGRASVADTAAMSHLGSVREMDDGGSSAYAASESYVSSYVSSEDDDGRPARSVHPRASHDPQQGVGSPQDGGGGGSNGGYSRHSSHRSGRQQGGGGRSGFSASSAGGSSSRHSGARSGFEEDDGVEYDDEEDESAMGRTPVSMEDIEYYSEEQASSRGGPLTNLEETHEGQRW